MSTGKPSPWSSPSASDKRTTGECPLGPLPTESHLRPSSRRLLKVLWIAWFTVVCTAATLREIEPTYLVLVGLGVPGLLIVAFILRILVSSERLNELNNRGLAALNEEQFDAAVERFEELVKASRGSTIHRQVALHNLALAELCCARWDRTLSLLAAVEGQYKASILRAQVGQSSAALLALTYALRGDLVAARCWLKTGEKRKDVPTAVGLEVLAEAIVHARAGNYDSAEQLLSHRWRAASSALSGRFLGALRFVRAYALVHGGGSGPFVGDLILGARPYTKRSFDFLFEAWPELQALVEREEGALELDGAATGASGLGLDEGAHQ